MLNRKNPGFLEQRKHLICCPKATPARRPALHPSRCCVSSAWVSYTLNVVISSKPSPTPASVYGQPSRDLGAESSKSHTAGARGLWRGARRERVSSMRVLPVTPNSTALYHLLPFLPVSSFQGHSGPEDGVSSPPHSRGGSSPSSSPCPSLDVPQVGRGPSQFSWGKGK